MKMHIRMGMSKCIACASIEKILQTPGSSAVVFSEIVDYLAYGEFAKASRA